MVTHAVVISSKRHSHLVLVKHLLLKQNHVSVLASHLLTNKIVIDKLLGNHIPIVEHVQTRYSCVLHFINQTLN